MRRAPQLGQKPRRLQLKTGGFGTALGVIRTAWARGALDKDYASETRPWL